MEQIRIALIDMRPLLSDLIERVLADVPQAAIVAKVNEPVDLAAVLDEARPDLAIAGASAADEPRLLELVAARPRMKALAVVGEGEHAVLYDLAPQRTPPAVLSSVTLLEAIRRTQAEWTWVCAAQPLS